MAELLEAQERKGLNKYGHTLDDCPDEKFDWRLMALEEMVDLLQYQQKEIIKLERSLKKANGKKEDYKRMYAQSIKAPTGQSDPFLSKLKTIHPDAFDGAVRV